MSLAKTRMHTIAREAAFRAASGKDAIGTDAIADAVTDALWPHISLGFARPPGKGAERREDPALLKPTTTAAEAGIPEGAR